ncbi:hypothetical protein ES708_11854 [subsurface metagenome]
MFDISPSIFILIIFGIYLALFFLGFPVSFAMGIASLVGFIMLGVDLRMIVQRMITGVYAFELLAMPFFILAANIMNASGISEKIFGFAESAVGWISGSMGHVNIFASMIFAGISGAATADAAGLGIIEMNAMRKAGYPEDFSAAITASSSMIGPIIPPSVVFLFFGRSVPRYSCWPIFNVNGIFFSKNQASKVTFTKKV